MLDLDRLAQKRAKTVNEKVDLWHHVLWGQPFQKLSQNMSDSEVESVVASCPSVAHLQALILHLEGNAATVASAPYSFILEQARQSNLRLVEWITALADNKSNSQL